jgi:hypothetical protein
MASLYRLNYRSYLAAILCYRIADREILQGDLVTERNNLPRVRMQGLVSGENSTIAIRIERDVHDCDADIVD